MQLSLKNVPGKHQSPFRPFKKGKRVTMAQNKKKKKISLRKAILREIYRAIG